MDFKDIDGKKLIEKVVGPEIEEKLGLTVIRADSLSVTMSGVIDNIMSEAIAESLVVLSEISTRNLGAYWEAGYAEGLGKPVIYLCEKSVMDDKQRMPHFDVRNLTSVIWDREDPTGCVNQLIATIKNSLRRRGQLPPTLPAAP